MGLDRNEQMAREDAGTDTQKVNVLVLDWSSAIILYEY